MMVTRYISGARFIVGAHCMIHNNICGHIVTDQDCIVNCMPPRAEQATYQDYRAHLIAACIIVCLISL